MSSSLIPQLLGLVQLQVLALAGGALRVPSARGMPRALRMPPCSPVEEGKGLSFPSCRFGGFRICLGSHADRGGVSSSSSCFARSWKSSTSFVWGFFQRKGRD